MGLQRWLSPYSVCCAIMGILVQIQHPCKTRNTSTYLRSQNWEGRDMGIPNTEKGETMEFKISRIWSHKLSCRMTEGDIQCWLLPFICMCMQRHTHNITRFRNNHVSVHCNPAVFLQIPLQYTFIYLLNPPPEHNNLEGLPQTLVRHP